MRPACGRIELKAPIFNIRLRAGLLPVEIVVPRKLDSGMINAGFLRQDISFCLLEHGPIGVLLDLKQQRPLFRYLAVTE